MGIVGPSLLINIDCSYYTRVCSFVFAGVTAKVACTIRAYRVEQKQTQKASRCASLLCISGVLNVFPGFFALLDVEI